MADSTFDTLEFFRRWEPSFDDLTGAFAETLAERAVWDQRPLAVTTGPEEAVRFLRLARRLMGLERIAVDVQHVAETADGVVLTTRIDHLIDRRGRTIVSAPVAGTTTWRDGRIVAWRELFDAASFGGGAVRGRALGLLRR